MSKPTPSERRQFWLWSYAQKCFEQVITACDFLTSRDPGPHDAFSDLLISGLVVTYFKPFVHCKGVGSMPESVVPAQHKATHLMLKDFRHKVVAHLDALDFQATDPAIGNMNQVLLARTKDDYQLSVSLPAQVPGIQQVRALAQFLEEEAADQIDKFAKRFITVPSLTPGLYKLSINPRDPLFIPSKF